MKKTIITILILVALVIAGIAGYYIWQYYFETPGENTPPVENGAGNTTPPATEPPIETSLKFKPLSSSELAGFVVRDSEVIGIKTSGEVVQIKNGAESVLSASKANAEILSILPSFDGSWILEKWGNNSDPSFSLYDTSKNSWIPAPKMKSADWSPNSLQIAYLEDAGDKTNLGLLKVPGLKKQTLASLVLEDVEITWLNPNEIIISDKPSKFNDGSVWKFKIREKTFTPLISEESGPWIKWDKDMNQGVKLNLKTNQTEVINNKGELIKTLPFAAFPNKCIFDGDLILCAASTGLSTGTVLPDDYLKGALNLSDVFLSSDTKTEEEKLLSGSDIPIDAINLQKGDNKLYFINRYDKKLYEIQL